MFLCNAGKALSVLVFVTSHTSQSWTSGEHVVSKRNVSVNPLGSEWVSVRCGCVSTAAFGGMEPASPAGEGMELGSHSCQGLLILWPPGGPAVTPGSGAAGSFRCLMNWAVLVQRRWMRTAALAELQDHFCALMLWQGKVLFQPLKAFSWKTFGIGCGNRFWDAFKSVLCIQIILDNGIHWQKLILFSLAEDEKNPSVWMLLERKVVTINGNGSSRKVRTSSDSLFSWMVNGKVHKGIPMKISISHIGMAAVVQTGSHSLR